MLVLLALTLSSQAADPLFDATLHVWSGAAGGIALPMDPDVPLHTGFSLMGWVTPDLGLGVRIDGGTYGLVSDDAKNLFPFLEAQYRLGPHWSLGAGVGTPMIYVDYYCNSGACDDGLWERHHPVFSANVTRDFELGPLRVPLSLRGEASQPRWALGVELGVGFRVHRAS